MKPPTEAGGLFVMRWSDLRVVEPEQTLLLGFEEFLTVYRWFPVGETSGWLRITSEIVILGTEPSVPVVGLHGTSFRFLVRYPLDPRSTSDPTETPQTR